MLGWEGTEEGFAFCWCHGGELVDSQLVSVVAGVEFFDLAEVGEEYSQTEIVLFTSVELIMGPHKAEEALFLVWEVESRHSECQERGEHLCEVRCGC